MARKKPEPDGETPKRRGRAKAPAPDPQRRRANENAPDSADAYVVMAENAPTRKEALALYEKAVAAGERALGPEAFRRDVGQFWLVLKTRPYMRARLGLAHLLWTVGRREEAIRHLQDLLRLNPGDNQGVRYTLAGFLLFLDRDDDLDQLLRQYPDEDSAAWTYTHALLGFRRDGDTIDNRRLLKAARKTNKHVPDYLLGRKFPPSRPPRSYSPGGESEALQYVGSFLAAWKFTSGAIAWLRENTPSKHRKADAPRPKGPLTAVKEWLTKRLPQEDDVWQADFRQLANWIRLGGEPARPWLVLVLSVSREQMLAHETSESPPAPALLWDALVQAMQHPAVGSPRRPTELQVRPDEAWESLRPHLEEIGVRLTTAGEPGAAADALKELSESIGGEAEPGLLDAPGVTARQVAGFYEAAAAFFRQAPWKKVGYESAIRVECDQFDGGPWYAVLMGQSGLTTGLALYDDLKTLQRLWTRGGDDEENARETVGTTVTFGEESEIPVADLEAAKRHGWRVARPDAYPSVFRKERGLSTRLPLAWELELLEACLRAIPAFVDRRPQDDPTREEKTVATSVGEVKLTLSWVVDWEAAV